MLTAATTPTPRESTRFYSRTWKETSYFERKRTTGDFLCFFKLVLFAGWKYLTSTLFIKNIKIHGLLVVGIAIGEPKMRCNYIDTYGVEYPVLLDSQEEAVDIMGLPVPTFSLLTEGYIEVDHID